MPEKKPEKKVRKICKNCRLYDPDEGVCTVTLIHEGEYVELQVKPNDRCWWERMEQELAMLDGEDTPLPMREVRMQYDLDNRRVRVEAPMEENPLNLI